MLLRVALVCAALAACGRGAAGWWTTGPSSPALAPSAVSLVDYGTSCKSGSECLSGVCGTSCSVRDLLTQRTTSCLCPDNSNDLAALGALAGFAGLAVSTFAEPPGCCGCLSYQPGKPAQLGVCPAAARSKEDSKPLSPLAKAPLAKGTLTTLYARLAEVGAMDDELVEAGVPRTKYLRPSKHRGGINKTNGIPFGAPCSSHDECQFGICGTGCDCVEEKCSCNCGSNFPFKTCGGCNRGEGLSGATVGPCPAGVNVTSFPGKPLWLPQQGENAVSLSYCVIIALERKLHGAVFDAPKICTDDPDRQWFWNALESANATDYATVEDLFESAAKRICKTPPEEPCRCDYYALVAKLGKAVIDPEVCVPPPPEQPEKPKKAALQLGLRAQLRSAINFASCHRDPRCNSIIHPPCCDV
jgi:hypothetical protein